MNRRYQIALIGCGVMGEAFVRLVNTYPHCKVLIGNILRHNKTYTSIYLPCNRKTTDVQLYYLIKMIETGCEAIPSLNYILFCMKTCFEADKQARECA